MLDDIWNIEDLQPFRVPSQRSRLLFTTRDKAIVKSAGIVGREIGELDMTQAFAVLKRWSRREENLPQPHASDILSECGGLALAISMIGAALSDEPPDEWERMVSNLRKAKLKHIGNRIAEYRYDTIHAAIAVSIEALSEELRRHYMCLAVLLEGTPAAVPVLQALWGGADDDVYYRMRVLVERSLARRDLSGIMLHDLQLKYLRSEHADPEALEFQRAALRRSLHVVRHDPKQFASQMTGRLIDYKDLPGISNFLDSLDDNAPLPWLRPLRSCLTPAKAASELVIEDPTGFSIRSASLNADGTKAVFTVMTGIAYWQKRISGLRIAKFTGEFDSCVRLTRDAKRAICCSLDDGAILEWDLESDRDPVKVITTGTRVIAFAINADGKRAVCACADETLLVCDLTDVPTVRHRLTVNVNENALSLSGDGGRLAFASGDSISVWNIDSAAQPVYIKPGGRLGPLDLSADGKRVVFSHGETFPYHVRVWDIDREATSRLVWTDRLGPNCIRLSADGKRIAATTANGRMVVCDPDRGDSPREYRGSGHSDPFLALSANGGWAMSTAHGTCQLNLWNLEREPDSGISADWSTVGVAHDGTKAAFLRGDGSLMIWSLSDPPQVAVVPGHSGESFTRSWSSGHVYSLSGDGSRMIACGFKDGRLRAWNIAARSQSTSLSPVRPAAPQSGVTQALEGAPEQMFGTHSYGPCAISFDGKRALAKLSSGPVVVYDLDSNFSACRFLPNSEKVTILAIANAGKTALAGLSNGAINLWNIDNNEDLGVVGSHRGEVIHIGSVRDTDGQERLLSIAKEGDIIVWELREGQIEPHQIGNIENAHFTFSSNGRWMFSIRRQGELQRAILWDLTARKGLPWELPGDFGHLRNPALNYDGTLLVCNCDRDVYVFDVSRERLLARFTADAQLTWCHWAGSRIIARDESERILFLDWEA